MEKGMSREEKMGAIQKKLEDGVKEIYSSEKYREYIRAMSKFPNYSINNCILIASQMPDASLVCGFKRWQKDFNRTVNKGERGIMILAPMKGKTEIEEEVFDENNKAVVDADGNQVTETVVREYQFFRPVYVFDVSQTAGDPVPTLATELDETVDSFEELKTVLETVSPVPISFEHIRGSANGYFSPNEKRIVIDDALPQLQMLKTMIHEIAHASLGHGSKEDKWDKQTKEVQAESVAYWVSQLLGFDTSEYSFGYISGWSRNKEVSELKENLDIIKKTADSISKNIEESLLKMRQEKAEIPMVSEEKGTYALSQHKKR